VSIALTPKQREVWERVRPWLALPEPLTADEWADRHAYVPSPGGGAARKYHTRHAPHQKGMMRAIDEEGVRMVVYQGASQVVGKTQCLLNIIGKFIQHDPKNIMVMYPVVEAAERFSKNKLQRMIGDTPALAECIRPARSRDSGNTILTKSFPGGTISLLGANSPSALRGQSAGVLIADEIDVMEGSLEGDPLDLFWKRGESIQNAVQIVASTPALKHSSRIDDYFERSDQRFWTMPCVHCGTATVFELGMLDFPKGKPEEAVLICPNCKQVIDEEARVAMYFAGEWQATRPFAGVAGFHMNAFYSPWPVKRGYRSQAHYIAEQLESAERRGPESLQVFWNTILALSYEQATEKVDWEGLFERREDYDGVPEQVLILTAGVDVQHDRLEAEIVGWGAGRECWGIARRAFFGDPSLRGVWDKLDAFLSDPWEHPVLGQIVVRWTCVDHGFKADEVESFCRPRTRQRIVPIKGVPGEGRPIAGAGSRVGRPKIRLYHAGTDTCKDYIYSSLKINDPGARYMHFPSSYDEAFFKQLTAETAVIERDRFGFKVRRWKKLQDHQANEALDIRVYALAALILSGVHLDREHTRLQALAKSQKKEQSPTHKKDQPKRPPRRSFFED